MTTTAYRGAQAIHAVAAIGGGVIGNGCVAAFLGSGRAVRLYDPMPDAATRTPAHLPGPWAPTVGVGPPPAGGASGWAWIAEGSRRRVGWAR